MGMRYGLPYQGSKNKIAEWVVEQLPAGEAFVDLFAGGCAVTHAAILSRKYKRFVANDILGTTELFLDAIHGKYSNEKRWISREDFKRLKDSDMYVSLCWSFGNNRCNYLYSREIEPWKRALHYARVLGDTGPLKEFGIDSDGSRKDIMAHKDEYKEKYIRWWLSQQEYTAAELDALIANTKEDIAKDEEELREYLLDGLRRSGLTQAEVQRRLGTQMAGHYFGKSQWEFPTEEMYRQMQTFMPYEMNYNEIVGLYRLGQRLERLQRLESLQSLEVYCLDYHDVAIPSGAVVYADPPYRGTCVKGYKLDAFDYESFDNWLAKVDFPVIVSEYTCPVGCVEIASKIKAKTLSAIATTHVAEKLFIQERYLDWYREQFPELEQVAFW